MTEGDWRTALACLVRANQYEQQANTMDPGESP
jgi:hypothetical protein